MTEWDGTYSTPPQNRRGQFDEDTAVKQPVLYLMGALGWEEQACLQDEWTDGASSEGRRADTEPILVPRLRAALTALNPGLPERAIERAIDALTEDRRAMPPQEAARAFHKLLRDGVKVELRNDAGASDTKTVRVIDWREPRANHFFLADEYWVGGGLMRSRLDIVGFVNGIPLLMMELKAPDVAVKHAFDDNLRHYLSNIPQFFTPNGITVLTNGGDTRLGSPFAPWEHFFDWKKVADEKEKGVVSLEQVLRGTCTPERLLDLIENYTVFEETRHGLIKKVAKNHQYLGVENAVEAVQALEAGEHKLGVFWHTQGSGKSLSMVYFAGKVLRKLPGGWTFVVVTDRQELDRQIYKTFAATGLATEKEAHAESIADLRQLLAEDHRFVFTLIHKFQTRDGAEHPILSERENIIVIVDEAHRSQYDTMAMNMRKALPNAAFIAFTGTPLLAGEEFTYEVFGDPVSVYNFTQSIEDGATVPLYYENRIPELQLDEDVFNEGLSGILERAELDEEQERELEKRFAKEYHLITRPDRLRKVAADLVEHFLGRGHKGKAMMVCIDKATAVRTFDYVQELWAERLYDLREKAALATGDDLAQLQAEVSYMEATDMAVVVSAAQNEAADLAEKGVDIVPHRKRMLNEDLDEKFKNPDDPLRLVFVCAMWITGFDAPSISTVYLDKPMKNHTLMQTIARANRKAVGKEAGLIVDYIGVFRNLQKALAIYGQPTGGGGSPIKDKAALVDHLRVLVEEARAFCTNHGAKLDAVLMSSPGSMERLAALQSCFEALVSPDDIRKNFLRNAQTVSRVYKAILPDERAAEFAPEAVLLSTLAKRIRDEIEGPDVSAVLNEVEALLDHTISAEDYRMAGASGQRLVNLSEVDFEALQEEFNTGKKKTAAERLKALLETKVREMARVNQSRADLLLKLQTLIERYNSGSQNIDSWFEDLKAFLADVQQEEKRGLREGLSEDELAMFDILTNPEPELTEKERDQVKRASKELLQKLKAQKLVLDWWKRQETRSEVRRFITDLLDSRLPEEPFDRRIFEDKCARAYEHVCTQYGAH
ncbi:type I restriction endonuclease subunit R [Hyphomonas sp.]|uniref:type I restriction endonuclease subunit R n=1 Tax=Hyphomonas sp. TaxID=87 RepID=UPI0025C025EF|nr:type I restriction endonuclease subunit R [Hyphomonas sp.]